MGKQLAHLKHFFEGKRRQCSLRDYHTLCNKADEKRIKLSLVMPLTNQPVDGMPEEFSEAYLLMDKQKSPLSVTKAAVILEGASFQIFATDVSAKPAISNLGATLQDFKIVGEGIDEDRTTALEFTAYLPGTISLRDWSWNHLHKDFFVEVVPAQMDLEEQAPPPKKGKKSEQLGLPN